MQCAGCNKETPPSEPARTYKCALCQKIGFYGRCCRTTHYCRACRAKDIQDAVFDARKNLKVIDPEDYLAKPWPPEAAGCKGCTYELRADGVAPAGWHTCGADEAHERPPALPRPPIEHGPASLPPDVLEVRDGAVHPVQLPKRPRRLTPDQRYERTEQKLARRRKKRKDLRDARWREVSVKDAALEEEIVALASDMTHSELRKAMQAKTETVHKMRHLRASYKQSGDRPPKK